MNFKKLTVTVTGPQWAIYAFEIEGIDVLDQLEEDAKGRSVTVKDFAVSEDEILDVFIKLGAPNRSVYTVELSGETESPKNVISYSEDFIVRKNGHLNIVISKKIVDILK